jgi:alkylation response protein AidB-like acyl-CoA dehydrogenase
MLLHAFLKVQQCPDLPGADELGADFTGALLDSAARFHERVFHPLNAAGDREGARLDAGRVRTPDGFVDAWARYCEGGWHRLSLPEEIGGAGLPPLLSVPISEITMATGHSLKMYGGFCAPAASMLSQLGDPWMRQHVVPHLVQGDWTATMCLTESHCGTDLRQMRTRAVPSDDGSWRLTGTKIFISGGDHDLTDNIAHIVLAKTPGADGRLPDGLAAVNVFLVSKHDIDPASGALGSVNGVSVGSIEHKMGIEASATCVLNFDNARAWRIAGGGKGGSSDNMLPMFLLMNHARIGTALTGIAYADLAYQNAAAYARERLSGRAAGGPRHPDAVADPIVVHADVRRMLLETRAFVEGARATALRVALCQSLARSARDEAARTEATDLLELMTPVMKAYFTDKGFESAVACQQVLGGHGYVRDWGLEQMVRNARIGQIYEGANGVQAFDLIARKLAAHGGRARRSFQRAVTASMARCAAVDDVAPLVATVREGLRLLESAHAEIDLNAARDPSALGAASYDLLTFYGTLALGWTWMELATLACDPEMQAVWRPALRDKRALAAVWFDRQKPLLQALHDRILRGPSALMALEDAEV